MQGAYVPVEIPLVKIPLYARLALLAKQSRNIENMVIMVMERRLSHMMEETYKPVQIVNTH